MEKEPGEVALRVRRKMPVLTAKRVAARSMVGLPDGTEVLVMPGDYLVSTGKQLLDVCDMAALHQRYDEIPEGGLTVPREVCRRLEATTGIGTTATALTLAAAVERLASIAIGEVQIEFTPGQLEEIAYRAKKRGRTIAEELQAVIDRIKDELFHRGG